MARIGVVGAGRVGAVLAAALSSAGHEITAIAGESAASRTRVETLLPGVNVDKPTAVARSCDVLLLTVPEPARETDAKGKPIGPVSLRDAWARWRDSPAFLLVLGGFAMAMVTLQANSTWAAAFLARVRELSPAEIGFLSGLSRGPALLIGSLLGAWITDRFARADHRWRFWVPGVMLMLGTPMELTYLLADSYWVWMPAYLLTGILIMGSQASVIAICMDVSGVGLRATGLAFALLLSNLIADLIGPTIIGIMNDTIFVSHGTHALRYSMGIVSGAAALGGLMIVIAARFETERTRSG